MEKSKALKTLNEIEKKNAALFDELNQRALINQEKVLKAFNKSRLALANLASSSGYGYEDSAKGKLNEIYADVFGAESAIVSPLITCGTHAIFLALSGVLMPNDSMLSITGSPYDTLVDCLIGKGNGSLADYNISFHQVEMIGDDIDLVAAKKEAQKLNPKMIYIQRSRGYSTRNTLSIEAIRQAITSLKEVCPNAIFMVDNCYGEFTETLEPTEVGADLIAGSLIKNPGGGLAPTGGYIAGKQVLIDKVNRRLTAPTIAGEVGSYAGSYVPYFEGIFIAPHVVSGAMKGNIVLGEAAAICGFKTSPTSGTIPNDIIRTIEFNDKDKMINFIQKIQELSPVDSFVKPVPYPMPGYNDEVIMAAGTFIQGASIEFSCDGPVRPPYIAYMQGGITYEHTKLVAISLLESEAQ